MSSNGWYSIDNTDYYFLPSGAIADGWVLEDNEWYYYPGGKDYTGWLKDGGNWYYCKSGIMLQKGFFITDGIYSEFDENGIWLGYNNPPQ